MKMKIRRDMEVEEKQFEVGIGRQKAGIEKTKVEGEPTITWCGYEETESCRIVS